MEERAIKLLDGAEFVGVAFKTKKGNPVIVGAIMLGEGVWMIGVGDAIGWGVFVENTGLYVGTAGREDGCAVLFKRTNRTATPSSKSMMMIASAMIRPT